MPSHAITRFVSEALGADYFASFGHLHAACVELGATDDDLHAVFCGNACRLYLGIYHRRAGVAASLTSTAPADATRRWRRRATRGGRA